MKSNTEAEQLAPRTAKHTVPSSAQILSCTKTSDEWMALDLDAPLDAPLGAPLHAPLNAPLELDTPLDAPLGAPLDTPLDAPTDAPPDAPLTQRAATLQSPQTRNCYLCTKGQCETNGWRTSSATCGSW